MNWGGFAGGFAQGFNNGVQMGKTVNDLIKQDKIDKIRAEGIAEAQKARQDAIDASVQDTQGKAASDAQARVDSAVPTTDGPKTGEAAPDNNVAQTAPVAQPVATAPTQPAPPAQVVTSPQSAVDAAPVRTPVAASGIAVPGQASAPVASSAPPAVVAPAEMAPPPAPKVDVAPAATGKRFMVNGVGFDSQDEARKYAEKQAPTLTEFMRKTMVPRMQEAYIAQGDPEKAAAWGKWADDAEHEAHAKLWAQTYQAAQAGDIDKAAQGIIKMYKNYDDGVSLVSSEKVKDKDGNITGFNVKLKTDATGETRSQFIDKRALTEMGLAALSPVQMFEQVYKRQQAADQLGAKAAIDAQNDARTFNRQVAIEGMKEDRADKRQAASDARRSADAERNHGYKLEELATAEELKQAGAAKTKRAELQSSIDLLKENGYTPDEVRGMIPGLLKAGEFKKGTSPDEARRMLVTELAKDPLFSTSTKEKQQQKIDDLMGMAGYGKAGAAPASPKATTVPNPLQPDGSAPAAKPKGIQVYDSKTGKIIYK
jgi:hypothetical protein